MSLTAEQNKITSILLTLSGRLLKSSEETSSKVPLSLGLNRFRVQLERKVLVGLCIFSGLAYSGHCCQRVNGFVSGS